MQKTKRAYAKINLVLNVLKKAKNNYHEVDFLMTTVDLYDEVTLIEDDSLEEDCIFVPGYLELESKKNLALLAVVKFKKKFNLSQKYKIIINKKIPIAAGMAGGSSDCAAALKIINQLSGINTSISELVEIGKELGSDVPFCLYSQLAHVTGFGEKIKLINSNIPPSQVLVINPGIDLSTKLVYQNHREESIETNINAVLKKTSYQEFYQSLSNDLQKTACSLRPEINQIIAVVKQFGVLTKVMVSGSGPTVLIFDQDEEKLKKIYSYFKKENKIVYLTKINN